MMKEQTEAVVSEISSEHSIGYRRNSKAEFILRQLKILFSAYPSKKDDVPLPEEFAAQLCIVMEKYSDDAIRYVTEPLTGLQRKYKARASLSIAAILDALDHYEYIRKERLRYQAMGAVRQLAPRPRAENFANVFVPPCAPQYTAMLERAEKCTDSRYYRYAHDGIWVVGGWLGF